MQRDAGDHILLFELEEDPDKYEAAIRAEIEKARSDSSAQETLESLYCEEDRDGAFSRFRAGLEFKSILRLLDLLRVPRTSRIVEVGGGPGWLAWALSTSGYSNVDLVEPNGCFITGTGYLRTRPDAAGIRIWNDLREWYGDRERYDLILTRNCVHHFRGLSHIAACIRQKTRSRGRWLMLREWFAETAQDTFNRLRDHPYSQRYRLYEFPHPAWHYIGSLERVGFELEALIPARYCNGVLESYVLERGTLANRIGSRTVDALMRRGRFCTRALYRMELALNSVGSRRVHLFTRPGAMSFRRQEISAHRDPADL